MIDFRYHFVSLMAVLIALTVGVVLGAGPLQGKLSDTLNDQVTQLSERQTELNEQSEELKADINDRNDYIAEFASKQLPGTLEGNKVALIRMHNVSDDDAQQAIAYLNKAGATVTADITINNDWFSTDKATVREEIVGQMNDYFEEKPAEDSSVTDKMTLGLYQVVTTPGEKSTHIAGLLSAKTNPLVTVTTPPSKAADSVVIMFARHDDTPAEEKQPVPTFDPQAITDMAKAAVATKVPTVLVGEAAASDDEIAVIRAASVNITTVDGVGRIMALVSTPLALGQAIDGNPMAVGFDQGAQVKLPPLERKPKDDEQ